MFYHPKDGHGLPHNPFNAIVTPRPIGWISTRNAAGHDNLAPYSFFNGTAYMPPQVMFATTDVKDSLNNIRETGVFCVNVVSEALKDAMNITSENFEASVDEFVRAGLEKADCESINCSRVAVSPASMECKMTQIIQIEGAANYVVFGEVTGVHMRDDCVVDGRFDVSTYQPLSRLGYRDYTVVREVFELIRPDE
jgi:flavin reductase (DIM6/NTAB) family NADH-FMN oxidoreductase RutF